MDINNNSICEFKSSWIDEKHKVVTFCELREKFIPYGICKICEKKNQYYKDGKQ